MGKKIDIDEDLVFKLAEIGCTYEEIATFCGVDRSTMIRRCAPLIKRGHQDMKQSLRRVQLKVALQGNVTMLIWLGKQNLGQKSEPNTVTTGVTEVKLEGK